MNIIFVLINSSFYNVGRLEKLNQAQFYGDVQYCTFTMKLHLDNPCSVSFVCVRRDRCLCCVRNTPDATVQCTPKETAKHELNSSAVGVT